MSLLAEYSGDLHPNSGTLLGVISPLLGELDPLRVGLWVVRVRVRDHRLAAFAWVKNKKRSPQPKHDGCHTRPGIPQPATLLGHQAPPEIDSLSIHLSIYPRQSRCATHAAGRMRGGHVWIACGSRVEGRPSASRGLLGPQQEPSSSAGVPRAQRAPSMAAACGGGATLPTSALALVGGVSLSPSPVSHGSTAEKRSTTWWGAGSTLVLALVSGLG